MGFFDVLEDIFNAANNAAANTNRDVTEKMNAYKNYDNDKLIDIVRHGTGTSKIAANKILQQRGVNLF